MEYSVKAQVIGAKNFSGDVEGKHYDSTTVFCLLSMTDVAEKNKDGERHGRGTSAETFKADDSRLYHKLDGMPMPINCELLFRKETNGSKVREVLIDIQPMVKK